MGALDPSMSLYYDFTIQQRFNTNGQILAGLPGLGPDLDFARLGNALRHNSLGNLEQIGTDFARLQHDIVTDLPLGYLHEDDRTNLALWSGDMSNAVHVVSNLTVENDSVVDPMGVANTNVRLTADAANATLLQSITSGSATRAFSVYIERVTGVGDIDLTVDGGVTWTTVALTAGWVRFFLGQAAVTDPQFGVRIVTSGDQIDYWGEDIESATDSMSHIPTEGSSVSRAQDISDGFDLAFYNALEGTLFGRAQTSFTPTGPALGYFTISDGSNSDQSVLAGLSTDFGNARVATSGAGSANISSLAAEYANGEFSRCALRVAVDDVEAYWDGVASPSPYANSDMPIGVNKVSVGDFSGVTSPWIGILSEIRYYTEGKNDQFLEDVTNGLIDALAPSGSLSDAILAATGGPTINDGLVTYYLANGAAGANGNHVNDLEREFLLAGISPDALVGDTVSDLWNQFLIKEGHTGQLNDMLFDFWSAA